MTAAATLPPAPSAAYGRVGSAARTAVNWGGILKGAAKITAIVVVAAVAIYAANAALPSLLNAIGMGGGAAAPLSTAQTYIGSAYDGLSWLGGQALSLATDAWTFLSGVPADIASWAGLTTTATSVNAAAAATGSAAKTIATGAIVTAAAVPVINTLHHTQLTQTVPMMDAHASTTAHISGMHEAAHHAAEHSHRNHAQAWADRVPQKRESATVAPRSGGFADQVLADTSALNTALGK